MTDKLAQLLTDLSLPSIAESLAWAIPLRLGPFARLIAQLTDELGGNIEYDTEHKMLHLERRTLGLPGQLDSVEIYAWPGRQARFCCTYVAKIDEWGNRVFRNTRLRPLTLKGLRRVLRDAGRGSAFGRSSAANQEGMREIVAGCGWFD